MNFLCVFQASSPAARFKLVNPQGMFALMVSTLGPAYNEFRYNKHPAITDFFASISLTAMLKVLFAYKE